jgi:hypothetical protein
MPELLRNRVSVRSSRVWLMAGALSLATLPALVLADSLPASVRACAAVTDVLQRLSCYDREVARYPAPAAKSATTPSAGSTSQAAPTPQAPATQAALAPPPAPTMRAAPAPQATTPAAASGSNTTPAPQAAAPAAASSSNTTAPAAGTSKPDNPQHVTAHIVSIEHLPNEMILHLDNGQVWQEVQGVSGDLSLREGDAVKIDKHFGSYYLTGPHVSSMKVTQKG